MAVSTRRSAVLQTKSLSGSRQSINWVPYEEIQSSPRYRDPGWLTRRWSPQYRFAKRVIDVCLASFILTVLMPFLPLVALLIKTDSAGPVFYSQERIGLNGVRFRIYKFRSMRRDAEALGAVYAAQNDPRVTRMGWLLRRTRIDEVPQIWNVLRGEMSLIGPRPERPENEQMLEEGIPGFGMRTCVKPGLTGWAQICAPYANTLEQSTRKLEFDMFYIRHASLWLDMQIIWRTTLVMLRLVGQ